MNIETRMKLPEIGSSAPVRTTQPPRTNSQIRLTANSGRLLPTANWKSVAAETRARWEKVPIEELAAVNGNFHKLGGLLRLRCQIGREEPDRQEKEFLAKHFSIAGSSP